MKNNIIGLFALLLLAGCSGNPAEKLHDFSLTLSWQTGALPDPYNYSYDINIGPGLSGEIKYYYDVGEWSETFAVKEEALSLLYDSLREGGILCKYSDAREALDGAPVVSLSVFSGGRDYYIYDIYGLPEEELLLFDEMITEIKKVVLPEIWEEISHIQTEHEFNYEY